MVGRRGVAEGLVRALLVVDRLEGTAAIELLTQVARRRARGVLQQRQVQALVAAVLLRLAGAMRSGLIPALSTSTARRDRPPAPVEANGGPLSERSTSGRPYSRNAAARIGQTCSVPVRPTA